ncbi:hypothetical protein ISS03_00130 [Patescibacteria group bacterium]|nr:hypothetical protein [Patescibacteria group bacterium]
MNFFTQYKKVFLVISFIGIVFLIAYAIYSLFFKAMLPTDQDEEPIDITTPSPLPIAGEGKINIQEPTDTEELPSSEEIKKPSAIALGGITQVKNITDHATIGNSISMDGKNVNFYDKEDGKFYTTTSDGTIKALSEKQFYNVGSVTWSPIKQKAIIEYPDGANIIYDFETEKQVTLPAHWEEFKFSPNGDKIALKSIGLDPNNRWLATVNDDGSGAKKIESIGLNAENIHTSWSPNNQVIGLETEGIDGDRQKVYFIGLNKENFKSTVINGRGFEHLWTPQGDKLVYSAYSSLTDDKPSVWTVNASGDSIGSNRKRLNVETWASKCTIHDENNLYCAVPDELPKGAGIFPELAKTTNDNFYKIDIKTGTKKLIAIPESQVSASDLIVSDDGQYLYYKNNTTEGIQQLKLK